MQEFNGTFFVDEIETAVDVDAVILGVPFEDNIETYPKGASLAPAKIREMSHFFSGLSFGETDFPSIHERNVLDIGNIDQNLSYKEMVNQLSKKIKLLTEKSIPQIVLGGDHSIALGTAQGLNNDKNIDGIVWVDAHVDLMDKYPNSKKFTRATVLRRILELNHMGELDVYLIGCRGHNLGQEELDFIQEKEINVLQAKEYRDTKKVDEFLNDLCNSHSNLYVSIDIDVLDPAFAPGVSVPEPGGLSTRELFHTLKSFSLVTACLEIVEVNPTLDINNITSMVASKLVYELMEKRV